MNELINVLERSSQSMNLNLVKMPMILPETGYLCLKLLKCGLIKFYISECMVAVAAKDGTASLHG